MNSALISLIFSDAFLLVLMVDFWTARESAGRPIKLALLALAFAAFALAAVVASSQLAWWLASLFLAVPAAAAILLYKIRSKGTPR